jgi:hypothetical protein
MVYSCSASAIELMMQGEDEEQASQYYSLLFAVTIT